MIYSDFLKHLEYSNTLGSFPKRIRYFDSILPKIGSGSGRSVYDIDGTKVLKLAKNAKGISQNEVEASISAYEYNHDIVTIVYDSDNNNVWLISEKAKKITPKRFIEILGFDLQSAYNHMHNRMARSNEQQREINPEIIDIINESDWINDIFQLIQDHDIKIGDFERISSFGEVIRGSEPTVVIIDYGLSDEVYTTHYDRSKRIYEMFNDGSGNDDLLTDPDFNTSNVEIINGGRGATPQPEVVDERVMTYMDNSDSVVVKDECRLGGGKTCNQGDINNLKIKNINEEVRGEDVSDVLGTINSIRTNQREVGFLGYIDPKYFNLINQSDIGLLPVDQGKNKIGYILYKNKEKALSLNKYLKSKGGYAKDNTPEEARIIGKLLEYSDETIEEYINRKYNNMNPINEGEIMSLSDLPFTDEINKIGGKIFSVGGAVRDKFLGKSSKDLDILITGVDMPTIEQILVKYGKVDAVGKSFGILKFKPTGSSEDIDVAIPRTEVPTDAGGHKGFDVKSDHTLPIEDDLYRRDFTINAIAQDIDGTIIDPYNGVKDLKNKIIRIVNPEAFSDDPLRILRAIQFSSRFGFTIEPKTMKLIKSNANRIKEIPPERILGEFDKIIQKGDPISGIKTIVSTGVYKAIFGVDFGTSVIPTNKLQQISNMGEFIFALIYNKVNNPSEFFKTNLKGDIDSYKLMKALEISYSTTNFNPVALRSTAHNMYVTSPQSLSSRIIDDKVVSACNELLNGNYPKTVNELAVNGGDLMSIGLKGKEIGDMQKALLLKIYSDKLVNTKEYLLAEASKGIQNKELETEGVGDKYAENKFGVPDEDSEFERKFITNQQINSEKPFGFVSNGKKNDIPVYKNPKSLANFDWNVRAISDSNGNLYVAFENGDFLHGQLGFEIGIVIGYSEIYRRMDGFVLLHRIDNTNSFGLSDTNLGYSANYPNEIQKLLRAVKLKNPQYEFYNNYFSGKLKEPIKLDELNNFGMEVNKIEKKFVLYSAVVLDEKSHDKLVKYFGDLIPNGWEIIAHHMTINLGELGVDNKQYLGMNIRLQINSFGYNDKVIACGCIPLNANIKINNTKPHITLAVNRINGGKPQMSNDIENWSNIKRPIFLTGKIEEIVKK